MEGSKGETDEASEGEVNAEDFWEVQHWFIGAWVLPKIKIPVGPMPDSGQHQQATENDVSSSNAFEAPEAWINAGFTGDTPAAPAASDAAAGHEGHDIHALPPHGV